MKQERYCKFHPALYVGARVKHLAAVKRKLTHGAGMLSVYLIVQAPEREDALAVIHAGFLQQRYYETHPLTVYGIAEGYGEAQELLVRISDEACAAGMPGALKAYLDSRGGGEERGT